MPIKQYIKKLNGYYLKDEEARTRAEEINTETNERIDDTIDSIERIDRGVLKFHAISSSSATYIVELPNGKNILIDTGMDSQWTDIKAAVDDLSINKFDYVIITHFHNDHHGNIQNFIDTYDCSSAQWFVQMKPDFTNHAADLVDQESLYDDQMALLSSNNIIPTIPENYSEIILDEENDVKVKFYNTDATIAEDYYDRHGDWSDKIDLNDFSLMAEIIHGDVKFLATGDIERPVEDYYYQKLGKVNLITAPHHGVNRDANRRFYQALSPDYVVCLYPTTSANWVKSQFRSFGYAHETGAEMITSYGNGSVNEIFTFESNGYNLMSKVKSASLSNDWYNYSDMYSTFVGNVNFTSQLKGEITLQELCANLPQGYTIRQKLDSTIMADFAQVITDLSNIFPLVNADKIVEISHFTDWGWTIAVYDGNVRFDATISMDFQYKRVRGAGNINTISTPTALAQILPTLPVGHYSSNYYQDTVGDVLTHGRTYALSIDVTLVESSGRSAAIMATIRSQAEEADSTKAAVAYFRESESSMTWRKLI